MVFVLYTSPTTTHALARACLYGGVRPQAEVQAAEQAGHEDSSGEPTSTP